MTRYRFTPHYPGGFFPGLPDRDLTHEEADPARLKLAVEQGWYAVAKEPRPKPAPKPTRKRKTPT
jgi:hypothetical protein